MKLKTSELQDAVTRVYKGVGNNKLIPLTMFINIMGADNTLLLTATDSVNFFTTSIDDVDCGEFEISVNADVFTKLVQKMTSETISLEVLDNYLMVVGNGKYKIDLFIDETGAPVKFPNKDSGEPVSQGVIKTSTIRGIIANGKASLAVSNEVPCLMNYYCGESVITTDRYKICSTDVKLFEESCLISPAVMELLASFKADEIKYYVGKDSFSFDSEHEFLYAPFVDGVEKMPVDAIGSLLTLDMDSMCRLPKAPLISVLDRLALFVSPYDKNGVYLTFNANGLSISSKKSSGSEVIDYVTSDNVKPFSCCIDIEMLRSQVNTIASDNIDLYFGSEIAIKFADEGVTKIVALMEDDRIG